MGEVCFPGERSRVAEGTERGRLVDCVVVAVAVCKCMSL